MRERLDQSTIDFIAIAERLGYSKDQHASSSKISILRSDSSKIAVYDNGTRGHYYINQRDPSERGDITELVKKELSCGFLEAKDFILGTNSAIRPMRQQEPERKKGERADFKKTFELTTAAGTNKNHYLNSVRKLLPDVLNLSTDARTGKSTNLFFHRDEKNELTGYEYRSDSKKGFSKGGSKALFALDISILHEQKIERIVIVESAINAFSYLSLMLNNNVDARFFNALIVSTAGRYSKQQADQILALALTHSAKVVLAQDNDLDRAGDLQANELKKMLNEQGIKTCRHKPKSVDWNDDLKEILV